MDRKNTTQTVASLEESFTFAPQSRGKLLMCCKKGLVVQLVRIHACHAWGRGFESRPDRNRVLDKDEKEENKGVNHGFTPLFSFDLLGVLPNGCRDANGISQTK